MVSNLDRALNRGHRQTVLDELESISGGPQGAILLNLFYKIHSGTVCLEKDKYLTPAPKLIRTRTSYDSPYTLGIFPIVMP